jgi:ADP-ribose pyrophosphatase
MQGPPNFRIAFSTPWFQIEESTVSSVGEAPYYRMTGPDGIICLPMTPKGEIVLIRQFRPSLEKETLEIPAGSIDRGEAPAEAAPRELLEETGYRCAALLSLGSGRLYLNRCTQTEYIFLGLDAEPVANARPESGITTVVMPRDTFHQMVVRDEIEQTAIMSIFGLASAKLGIDLMRDPIDEIRRRVLTRMAKE